MCYPSPRPVQILRPPALALAARAEAAGLGAAAFLLDMAAMTAGEAIDSFGRENRPQRS